MAGVLFTTLSSLDFGTVQVGQNLQLTATFQNIGDTVIQYEGNGLTNAPGNTGTPFTLVSVSISPGALVPVNGTFTATVQFAPTANETDTGDLFIYTDATNNVYDLPLKGIGSATGGIQITPGSNQFPATQINTSSAQQNFVIKNTQSSGNVIINSISVPTGFTLSLDPTPVTLTPGGTATFGVKFSPTLDQFYMGNAVVTYSSILTANVPVSGLGQAITSAFNLTSSIPEKVLVGFIPTGGGQSLGKLVDPTNLVPDTAPIIKRVHNFGTPGEIKSTVQVFFKYEDFGAASVKFTFLTSDGLQSMSSTVTIGGANDQQVKSSASGQMPVLGEIVELDIQQVSGPVSIVDYYVMVDDDRARLGTSAKPLTLNAAFNVASSTENVVLVDFNGVTQKADPTTACETNSVVNKIFDFWFPEADFPIRGYDKTTYRLEMYYEDLGNFTLKADMRNRTQRNLDSTQTLSVVGVNDGNTKLMVFDLNCSDELQQLTLTRTAGICSLVLAIVSLQPGAEIVKST